MDAAAIAMPSDDADAPPAAAAVPPRGAGRVLYLVHDLGDSAVARRVAMLESAGAEVTLAGFVRDGAPPERAAIVLGRTRNGRLAARSLAVGRALAGLRGRLAAVREPDLILARNLEMLALARRARALWGGRPGLVYEVLDIHRVMLGGGLRPRALRWLERRLAAPADCLVTSSPAFVRVYFRGLGQIAPETAIVLAENRPFLPDGYRAPPAGPGDGGDGPVRIGWFGILRCRASLDALAALTARHPGRFRVTLAGRPAPDVLPDFHAVVAACPDIAFLGPYRSPGDLPALYGACDLAWLIDRYEAGGNSEWLLPNRLYEGCLHGAVPVALAGTECARLTGALGIGVTVGDLSAAGLERALAGLDRPALARLRREVLAVDPATWHMDRAGASAFMAAIAARRRPAAPDAPALPGLEAAR